MFASKMAKKKMKDGNGAARSQHQEKQRLAALATAKKRNDLLQLYLKVWLCYDWYV